METTFFKLPIKASAELIQECMDLNRTTTCLPVYHLRYGVKYVKPSFPHIMKYSSEYMSDGEISYVVGVPFSPVVEDFVSGLFSLPSTVSSNPLMLVKTVGNIEPHVDENGRKSAVNILLENSRFSDVITEDGEYTGDDGDIYLLDTNRVHSVRSVEYKPKLFLTRSFPLTYADLFASIRF